MNKTDTQAIRSDRFEKPPNLLKEMFSDDSIPAPKKTLHEICFPDFGIEPIDINESHVQFFANNVVFRNRFEMI